MNTLIAVPALVMMTSLAGCARDPAPDAETGSTAAPAAAVAEESAAAAAANAGLPQVVVHKSPTCGCCQAWAEHMQDAGFPVETRDTQDLDTIKAEVGVPFGQGSCHTARVGKYFIEGHVPADDVKRLLAEKPDARGLTVPGMPIGSPGMEQGEIREPYDVLLVARDGTTTVFAHHGD
ncbi:MAG: DUF411 domain-containing protein [Steroidobacteraceae bacterium]